MPLWMMFKNLVRDEAGAGDGTDGSGGGGGEGRSNDSTPSLSDYDWDGEFAAVKSRLEQEEGAGDDDGTDGSEAGAPPPAAPSPSPAPSPAPASPAPAPTDHKAFPKSWSKDLEQVWSTIPEAAQQQIHKREQDVLRGINYYKQGHDFAQSVMPALEPYKELIQEGAIQPQHLVTNLLRGHWMLANAEEDQRVGLFKTLADQYNVPPAKLIAALGGAAAGAQGEDASAPWRAEIQRLTTELNTLKSHTSALANTEQARVQQQREYEAANAREAVAKLVGDTNKYPFANELLPDMYRLVASGAVTSLEEAYEQAQWANASTRQKLIQREQEAARERARNARKSSDVNVRRAGLQGSEGDPPTSLDEDLATTLKEIRARG